MLSAYMKLLAKRVTAVILCAIFFWASRFTYAFSGWQEFAVATIALVGLSWLAEPITAPLNDGFKWIVKRTLRKGGRGNG